MVITIGREFGSGGKYIGEKLAEDLKMKLYDKEILDKVSEESGIIMEIFTDCPGMQIYTGNFLLDKPGKGGRIYPNRSAVAFETQQFPDAMHHENFPSPLVKAGENFHTETEYRFSKI